MATGVERSDIEFSSGGTTVAAWLYRPGSGAGGGASHGAGHGPGEGGRGHGAPAVVMAHGLGAVREMRLDAYAERFATAGLNALVFDYRHFGASGGEPRQLLDIRRQHEDWAAALAHVRGLPGIDPRRVALWGTSFSGGHVLHVAAVDGAVAAVVAQCPFTDGPASIGAVKPRVAIPLMGRALADQIGAWMGRPPRTVALTGPPGSVALMTAPDADAGYRALIPAGSDVPLGVAARIALHIGRYRPGRDAGRLTCPVLFCVCDEDSVAPAAATLRAADRCPNAQVEHYPVGHFDIYLGEAFERAVADQVAFLTRHLGAA